jgi:hypothetical protein
MDNEALAHVFQTIVVRFKTLLASLCYVTASITHLVSVEVGWGSGMLWSGSFATGRHCTFVAVIGMEMVIYMATKVGRAVEPWAGTDEDTAVEPLRAIVAVGSTAIGRYIIVAVGAVRGHSDVDGDLGLGFGGCREGDADYNSERKVF